MMTESPLRNLRVLRVSASWRIWTKYRNTHLADEAVLVDTSALLSLAVSGKFCPHFLDILKDHVAMSVECFYAGEEFAVVATRDDDLVVVANGGLQDGEGTSGELVLFDTSNLVLAMQSVSRRDGEEIGVEFT
jgi:hypothetical protein